MKREHEQLRFAPVTTREEMSRVAALGERIWREHYASIIGVAQVEYMIDKFQSPPAIEAQISEGFEYFLILNGAVPIGYFAIQLRENGELFLSKIYLTKESRGRGRGRSCLKYIVERARELNAAAITLTVNKGNEGSWRAYEAWGFERTRPVVIEIGNGFVMDDWEYRFALDTPA